MTARLPAFVVDESPPLDDARIAAALALLRRAADEHPGRAVLTTSLGAEDMVLTDLIARHRLPIAMATLDTGRLFEESAAMMPRIHARYSLSVERWTPDAAAVAAFDAANGLLAMRDSVALRRACCGLRKVEPLGRLLRGRTGWVTGLRRVPGGERDGVPDLLQGPPGHPGITQYNPLAAWTPAQVWQYIGRFDVPYHPLHDRFFASIGCAPCTRAIAAGEDERAGRWWWESDAGKECGLHAPVAPLPFVACPAAAAARSPAHTRETRENLSP